MEYIITSTVSTFKLIIGFILLILAIFFWVQTSQTDIVNDITSNFVERVRYEGYIDRDMYETYMKSVSLAPYKIIFRHVSYNKDGSGRRVETTFTEKDIVSMIYSDEKVYKMQKGDDFIVIVSELEPSPFQVMMQSVTKAPAKYGVVTSKGGMVFNASN